MQAVTTIGLDIAKAQALHILALRCKCPALPARFELTTSAFGATGLLLS